jgi:hypothetical protein
MVEDDPAAVAVPCPKCGARPAASPSPAPANLRKGAAEPDPSVFVPADEARPRRRGRRLLLAAMTFVAIAGVAAVVAWPYLRGRARPEPAKDPVTSAANSYLKALTSKDAEAAKRLGTVDIPPAIRSFREVRRDPAGNLQVKGTFAPIAALHARIDEAYALDAGSGRYAPRNALGMAADVLDTLNEAKEKMEKDGIYKKMQSGSPDDLFDAAEALAKPFEALSKGVLSPRKVLPTYKMLVENSTPPLPPSERALALDYADRGATWDALLKRPFQTLKADGPFLLERAEVTASIVDALGSPGDPPTTLRLTLTRFRLEGIDTEWRVTAARRETPTAVETKSSRHE